MKRRCSRDSYARVLVTAALGAAVLLAMAGVAMAAWTDVSPDLVANYGVSEEDLQGISQGYDDGTWKPQDRMLRKHFIKMAMGAFGLSQGNPAVPTFSDVLASDPYYGYVEGAVAAGLTEGVGGGRFAPDRSITREQAAAMIARWLAGERGVDLATRYDANTAAAVLSAFSDAGSVSPSLVDELAYLVDESILRGAQGLLQPKQTLTRIQGAVMLLRARDAANPGGSSTTTTISGSTTTTSTTLPSDGLFKICGYVVDKDGDPADMNVAFDAFGLGDQGFVKTDSSGYYEKRMPEAAQYIVSVNPGPAKQIGKYSFPTGYLSERKLVIRNGGEARVDFTLRDGGTLWLQAYDQSGREMTTRDYLAASMIGAFPLGVYPHGKTVEDSYGGFGVFWGWIAGTDSNLACLLLPPGQPVEIWALWRLPEVGTTFLHADNDGKGFSVEKGGVLPMNAVYEFAKTEYQEASRQYVDLQGAGYDFGSDVANWLVSAGQNLSLAESLRQQGAEGNSAVTSYQVLTKVIKAKEQIVIDKAQQDIEINRKGNVTVTLTDKQGKKLADAKVEYHQTSHDFIFSVGWPFEQEYKILRDAGFEYACFESWWGEIEKSDGAYQFPDAEVTKLQKAGFGIVMHASVWTTTAYQLATPQFLASASPVQLGAQANQYSYDVIKHYQGKIKLYNVFNEPDQIQAYEFTAGELVDLVASSLRGARKADPNIITNLVLSIPVFKSVVLGGLSYTVAYDMYGNPRPGLVTHAPPVFSGYDFVKALQAAGSIPDAVGLEYYYGVVLPPIDLSLFADNLDFYGTVSKKIFVSELSYATLDDYPGLKKYWSTYGGWHQGYTDEAQADWAKYTMTIAFSKPSVIGVQWVGAKDGPTSYDFVGDGLFHSDGVTPRPVVTAIGDSIKSWTTQGNGTTDKSGLLTFRGFAGDYSLKITTASGRVFYGQGHITEQKNSGITLVLETASK